MVWSNPGPAKRVVIEAPSGDLLVYDGSPFPGAPLGTLLAALSGVAGSDSSTPPQTFWKGLSLIHGVNNSVNFGINDLGQGSHGQLYTFIDGLLQPHLNLDGPNNASPRNHLDFGIDVGFIGNDLQDTGLTWSSVSGGVSLITKSGTQIAINSPGVGRTVFIGTNGTPFGQLEFGSFTAAFSASNSVAGTLTYPSAFSAAPGILVTGVQIGANLDVLHNWTSAPTASSAAWRVFQKSGTNITGTATVYWLALGAI